MAFDPALVSENGFFRKLKSNFELLKKTSVRTMRDQSERLLGGFCIEGKGFAPDASSTVYCARPRRDGQSADLDVDGTPMYSWAVIRPVNIPPADSNLPPVRRISPESLPFKALGVFALASADGALEAQPAFVLKHIDDWTGWKAVAASDFQPYPATQTSFAQGLAAVPSYVQLTAGPGVDPLLVALTLCEWTLWKFETEDITRAAMGKF